VASPAALPVEQKVQKQRIFKNITINKRMKERRPL
jgi:hypothetical protein